MTSIDIDKFSKLVKEKRAGKNLTEVADEIGGVSISTLSRIEKGKVPDLSTFIKICSWLGLSPNDFAPGFEQDQENHQEQILYHLRADSSLPGDVSESLKKMIEIAYKHSNEITNTKTT